MSIRAEFCRCGCGVPLPPVKRDREPRFFLRGHHRRVMVVKPIAERFWRKVNASGDCWVWMGATHQSGYGSFALSGVRQKPQYIDAHRAAYELWVGSVPEGLCVCHHCDNRLCVRPTHLFIGTYTDNMRDMIAKGRAAWQKNRVALGAGRT